MDIPSYDSQSLLTLRLPGSIATNSKTLPLMLLYHSASECIPSTIGSPCNFSVELRAIGNGGDRTPAGVNEQEFSLCTSLGIVSVFGVGGDKTASSSNFLGDYVQAINKK